MELDYPAWLGILLPLNYNQAEHSQNKIPEAAAIAIFPGLPMQNCKLLITPAGSDVIAGARGRLRRRQIRNNYQRVRPVYLIIYNLNIADDIPLLFR